jgi:hypothetical protein
MSATTAADQLAMPIPSYATLLNQKIVIPSSRTQYVAVDRDHLIQVLKPAVRRIYLDEDWYLKANPDIRQAIKKGVVASAREHYVTSGYFEHRLPYEIVPEEAWYLEQYPDVAAAVKAGLFSGARDHFRSEGYREGRLPYANFSLRSVE